MNQKPSILTLLIYNLPAILLIAGLTMINISIYYLFDVYIGLLATGVTLIVIALILNHEQNNLPTKGR